MIEDYEVGKETPKEREIRKSMNKAITLIKDRNDLPNHRDLLGICLKCIYLEFAESQFTVEHLHCSQYNKNLNEKSKITNCSQYRDKTAMTLAQMQMIATIIDVDKKESVGFRMLGVTEPAIEGER